MNPPKCKDEDSSNFLIATPRQVSAPEAARVHPEHEHAPAPDAFTRLLPRLEPEPETLWREAQTQVCLETGILVLDASPLDKPYAKPRMLVTRHWSGKHHAVVRGINLLTLLWTEGARHVPGDSRLCDKAQDGLSKNDHFQQLRQVAHTRGFRPACVVFDSWYAGLDNLQVLRSWPWLWLTRVKATRHVNPDRQGLRPLSAVEMGEVGRVGWLAGDGLIRVFKIVAPDGDSEYGATHKTDRDALERVKWANFAWTSENYHRGVKQYCLIERAQVRSARAGRTHISLCVRAFLRLESHWYHHGLTWFEAKTAIIRDAVRHYLAHPRYSLIPAA